MHKWEYLVVNHIYYPDKPKDRQWALSINNELHPLTADEASDAARLLNRFGDQGWELVQQTGSLYLLKRPKQ